MQKNEWYVYLSGEIHTNWREEINKEIVLNELPISTLSPVVIHTDSDNCGAKILGEESNMFWHDYKGASINSIRNNKLIRQSDIVVVRFGEKYRQWNAAFDAGLAIAMKKPLITLHDSGLNHALKEIDAASSAVCNDISQVISILSYLVKGRLES